MDPSSPLNVQDIFSAKGLVIVLTGGGTGIGLAFASALYRTGAKKVYILGRRKDVLASAAKSIDSSEKVVVPVQADVADVDSIKSVAQQVEKEVGYIDVLINNAGISGPDQRSLSKAQSIEEIQRLLLADQPGWDATFAINSKSVSNVSAAFLHLLDAGNKRRGFETGKLDYNGEARKRTPASGVDDDDGRTSQIITVTSIAAFNRFVTAGVPYSSSKAAATLIGKALSSLLAPWGIRSNVVAPGSKLSSQMLCRRLLIQYFQSSHPK
jgi:NAD(P)-dependent dehydrogenase (short-subunit alcohol dehydrogenase family)